MGTPRLPNHRRLNLEHKARAERYAQQVRRLYDELARKGAFLASQAGASAASGPFSFGDCAWIRREAEKMMRVFAENLRGIVMSGISEEWGESNLAQDLVAKRVLTRWTGSDGREEYARYYQTNPDVLKAFAQRREGGMDLSSRVWNLSELSRMELEDAISVSLAPGVSAAELSREVRRCLNDPDLMFRRFRYKDESGKWRRKWKKRYIDADGKVRFEDCDRASYRDAWTGKGYYKSAARNAMRLARTEINMAYRTAERTRWQQMDFVVGFEVKTTQNGRHEEDMCDRLAGKYPKDFKFVGWHPQCMCYAIPILKTEDEFWDLEEGASSVNEVRDVPEGFRDWVKENEARIAKAREKGTAPWFIRDNGKVVDDVLRGKSIEKSNLKTEIKESERIKSNLREIEGITGYPYGEPMSFEEANELRGNPNYKKGVKYRVNCQSSVLANEMRRRGFDVEAYGNTKQDWFMPSVLAKKPEIAFMDAAGELPIPKGIAFNGDLLSSLNGEMKETGRYHLRFRFANDGGHIITAERLPDGSLRIYDPQSGKIIKDFSEYTSKVKPDSFEYYRVDNLQINPNVAKGAVKPSKTKGEAPRMQLPEIKEFLEKGWYGEEDFYSRKIESSLRSLRDKKKKEMYFERLLSNNEFELDHISDNGCRTMLHPGHKIKDRYWEETRNMAHALNRSGRNVVFLPEHENISMADAVTVMNGQPRVVDFKYSTSVKFNTLQQHLAEGFRQAGAIVLKLENMDAGQFKDTIEYMKRNDLPLGDIILINSRNKTMELDIQDFRTGGYKTKIKGFLR